MSRDVSKAHTAVEILSCPSVWFVRDMLTVLPIGLQVNELNENWSVTSDLKRYLYHTTPEEFVKRINSLISPDMAATIVSSPVG